MSPPADHSYDTRPIDSPVQPCTSCHWFSIELLPCADKTARKAWWPPRRRTSYPSEAMKISLAGLGPRQKLDGNGSFKADKLPAGDASLSFDRFFAELEDALATGRKF